MRERERVKREERRPNVQKQQRAAAALPILFRELRVDQVEEHAWVIEQECLHVV